MITVKFNKLVMPDRNEINQEQRRRIGLLAEDVTVYGDVPKTEREIIRRIDGADAILTSWIDIDEKILSSCPNLKYIGVMATGYGWIDIKTAAQKGITVTNVPHYSTESVVELIVGNLIALMRHTLKADRDFRSNAGRTDVLCGDELRGKTIGIVGLGEIGGRLAELSSAFGMKVIYNSRTKKKVPYEFCGLEELLRESEVVSVNFTLNRETKGLIGDKEFGMMKDNAIFVNFVHGDVVDEKAMLKRVKSGKIRVVLDDVQDKEVKKELTKMDDKVVLTPHIGFFTREAVASLADISIGNARSFLEGNAKNKVS